MKKYSIILAGGLGLRMKSVIPKQFLEIDGKPIIVLTIQQFLEYDKNINLIVVLRAEQVNSWKQIQKSFLPNESVIIAIGGETRTESVRAGLNKIYSEGLVAIHDAVRPFVSKKTIAASFDSADLHGSGVSVIELKDSIRKVDRVKGSSSLDRRDFRLVQTPQTFRINEIKKAYDLVEGKNFSDDASLYEDAGFKVKVVAGTFDNIKITTPEDIQ